MGKDHAERLSGLLFRLLCRGPGDNIYRVQPIQSLLDSHSSSWYVQCYLPLEPAEIDIAGSTGSCTEAQVQLITLGVLSIITDVMLIVMPIPILIQWKRSWKK